ncbi:MAG TPA: PEP-CTERM sorting domain-containing protein [Opitutaceae bacterium]|nr:PEP-CTERM sorting domain-containing protein [Opitutaceae bacterium]
MKSKLTFLAFVSAATFAATAAHAQITLNDFSSYETPNTFFYGDWALSNPFGDNLPVATFTQGAGFYNFSGGSNADDAFSEFFFDSPLDLGTNDQLTLSLKLLAGNTADDLTVRLVDLNGDVASATFALSDFSSSFALASHTFTPFGAFDPTDVVSFQISGNVPGGGAMVDVAIDNLSVTSSTVPTGAVPEPSTYGLLGAVSLAALAFWRRKATRR